MGVSPKVGFSAVGAAMATIIWTVVAVAWPGSFTDQTIATMTGSTGVVIGFVLGFIIKDPARGEQPAPAHAE